MKLQSGSAEVHPPFSQTTFHFVLKLNSPLTLSLPPMRSTFCSWETLSATGLHKDVQNGDYTLISESHWSQIDLNRRYLHGWCCVELLQPRQTLSAQQRQQRCQRKKKVSHLFKSIWVLWASGDSIMHLMSCVEPLYVFSLVSSCFSCSAVFLCSSRSVLWTTSTSPELTFSLYFCQQSNNIIGHNIHHLQERACWKCSSVWVETTDKSCELIIVPLTISSVSLQ